MEKFRKRIIWIRHKKLKKGKKEILTTIENKIQIKEPEQDNIYSTYNEYNIENEKIETKEIKDTNIKKNTLSLSNRYSQGSCKGSLINKVNYISFTNTDNKCVSFGKDINVIKKISYQKNSRKSFCPSLPNPNNFLACQSKKNSSQSNTLKTKTNTFNRMNSLLYQCSNLKSGTCASSKKKSTRISKRSIQNIRIEYLKKLKRKIKYLKKSKNYYKDLFIKQFTGKENIKIKNVIH